MELFFGQVSTFFRQALVHQRSISEGCLSLSRRRQKLTSSISAWPRGPDPGRGRGGALEGRRFRYARSLRRIKGNPIRLVNQAGWFGHADCAIRGIQVARAVFEALAGLVVTNELPGCFCPRWVSARSLLRPNPPCFGKAKGPGSLRPFRLFPAWKKTVTRGTS